MLKTGVERTVLIFCDLEMPCFFKALALQRHLGQRMGVSPWGLPAFAGNIKHEH